MPTWLVTLLWFIGIVVSVAVVFGIAAPFIWDAVFGGAPEGSIAMSSMLTVLLGILALGVAFGGLTVYTIFERQIENKAIEINKQLESKASEITKRQEDSAQKAYEESEIRNLKHRAQLGGSEGYTLWVIYDSLKQLPGETMPTLAGILDQAIKKCDSASSLIAENTTLQDEMMFTN